MKTVLKIRNTGSFHVTNYYTAHNCDSPFFVFFTTLSTAFEFIVRNRSVLAVIIPLVSL